MIPLGAPREYVSPLDGSKTRFILFSDASKDHVWVLILSCEPETPARWPGRMTRLRRHCELIDKSVRA